MPQRVVLLLYVLTKHVKHRNTAKVPIGIALQGTVAFVSDAWGGCAGDKYVTENCGTTTSRDPACR